MVEKKSGMNAKTFAQYLAAITLENIEVIQGWKPLYDVQPLGKFPKSVQMHLLKSRKNPNSDVYVKIDNAEDGGVRLSLYEMEKEKEVAKTEVKNSDEHEVETSATQSNHEVRG